MERKVAVLIVAECDGDPVMSFKIADALEALSQDPAFVSGRSGYAGYRHHDGVMLTIGWQAEWRYPDGEVERESQGLEFTYSYPRKDLLDAIKAKPAATWRTKIAAAIRRALNNVRK